MQSSLEFQHDAYHVWRVLMMLKLCLRENVGFIYACAEGEMSNALACIV